MPKFNVEVSYVDQTNVEEYEQAIKPNTKVFFF